MTHSTPSPPVDKPHEIIAMSVALGLDMTPNQDLDERLAIFEKMANDCLEELERLRKLVEGYSHTVKDLNAVFDKPCEYCEQEHSEHAESPL